MTLIPVGPMDVVEALRVERSRFVELLRSLVEAEWRSRTECPAYDVQGIAAHILGDDFSLLSRQRDAAAPGVIRHLVQGQDFRAALDRFNDGWVESVEFFSPSLLIDLLEITGQWTAEWYATTDPHAPGEPVGFFGATGPSPYWQLAAREYVERWVHHHQIRRALRRPDLNQDALVIPAVDAVVRSLAAHLRDLGAAPNDSVVLSVDELKSWTLVRATDGWQVFEGIADNPTATLALERSRAISLFTRGVTADEIESCLRMRGDHKLAQRLVRGIVALAGR